MFNKVFIIVFLTLLCSVFTTYLTVPTLTLLSWVNTLFIMALLLLTVGCTIMIWQGGFFNGLIWSFKYFLHNIDKSRQVIKEIEGKVDNKPIAYKMNRSLMQAIIVSGMILVSLSLIISVWLTL